ncbi:MAG: hypothetical protein V7K38_24315 [Nostoc sp.]|uniref:hypothetical protein n=1 Tax=Nostoc sp. TaxID=1180 RepID=UPI002FF51FCC
MKKFAKVLLLALIFAAPATVFASQAQAKTTSHVASVKSGKVKHHRHYKHHTKNLAPKTHK